MNIIFSFCHEDVMFVRNDVDKYVMDENGELHVTFFYKIIIGFILSIFLV